MLYDYKSDEIIQDCILDDLCEIVEDIKDEYTKLHRYDDLTIYAPNNVVRVILDGLLEDLDDIFIQEESHGELLYKNGDVVMTIDYNGAIFIESAYDSGVVKQCESVINYVYDSFKKKDVDRICGYDDSPVLVFGIKDETDTDLDTCNGETTYISRTRDGEPRGFIKTWSKNGDGISYYSSYSHFCNNVDVLKRVAVDFDVEL